MPTPKEYREELRTACEKCRDAYEAKFDALDKDNVSLADKVTDLEDKLAQAERRYAKLAEIMAARVDQAKRIEA